VGAQIAIFLSHCPFGFSLDEGTNHISIVCSIRFFGKLGIKIITTGRPLSRGFRAGEQNLAPGKL
jgi:hypothetical protein